MHSSAYKFAPGLMQILQSSTAPAISEFKTLPPPLDNFKEKLWGVYLLVLEKDSHCPRIYIGSGTSSECGVRSRLASYQIRVSTGKCSSTIPHYVETSLKEGYTISHKCLLAWTPLPRASARYKLRCFTLVVESVFTLYFWAMKSLTKDYYMPALYPWPRDSLTYHGCCTHFSINEQIIGHDEDATPEEIDRVDSERKRVKSRQYIANKGPGVHAANTKSYGEKALEEQRYECTVCELAFRSNAKLLQHQKRPIHIRKEAGTIKTPAGRGGSQRAVASKRFWCEPCQHATTYASRLETHLKGPRHAKKLAYLGLSSSELE